MAQHLIKTIGMTAGLTTALVFTGMSSQAFAMSPFQATYQFSYNGKNMGSATRTLTKSGNNWTYVFAAKAAAIASATETSHKTLKSCIQKYLREGKLAFIFNKPFRLLIHLANASGNIGNDGLHMEASWQLYF
jgi:hypothetical protein